MVHLPVDKCSHVQTEIKNCNCPCNCQCCKSVVYRSKEEYPSSTDVRAFEPSSPSREKSIRALDGNQAESSSLTRSGGGTVGLGSSGAGTGLADVGSHMDGVGQRSLAHAAQGLASGSLAVLLVGGEVEGDEENQVRAEDANASKGSKLLTSALASIGHVGEVGRGEVGVRGEVDEACFAKRVSQCQPVRE